MGYYVTADNGISDWEYVARNMEQPYGTVHYTQNFDLTESEHKWTDFTSLCVEDKARFVLWTAGLTLNYIDWNLPATFIFSCHFMFADGTIYAGLYDTYMFIWNLDPPLGVDRFMFTDLPRCGERVLFDVYDSIEVMKRKKQLMDLTLFNPNRRIKIS